METNIYIYIYIFAFQFRVGFRPKLVQERYQWPRLGKCSEAKAHTISSGDQL